MHYSPKQRVLICEPRCELYSWTNAGREFHRIEIAGEPITCAWKSAKDAWSAALRALNLSSSPFRAEELFKVVNAKKGEPPNEVRPTAVPDPRDHSTQPQSVERTGGNQSSTETVCRQLERSLLCRTGRSHSGLSQKEVLKRR